MAATLYEPAFAVVAAWFERDRPPRRAARDLRRPASPARSFCRSPAWLVERLGWRPALLALAAVLAAATVLPHALLLRRRPEDLGLLPDGARPGADDEADAIRPRRGASALERGPARPGLLVADGRLLPGDASPRVAVGVSLIPYLTERGDGAGFAAAATGLIGAAQVGARVVATVFGGRLSQVALTALVFALQAVALVVLIAGRRGPACWRPSCCWAPGAA